MLKLLLILLFLSLPRAHAELLDPADYAGRVCVNNGDENFCRVCNIFFEAGVEPYLGKVQVGRVIEERRQRGLWGKTACNVVWAKEQFSWTFLHQSRRLPRDGKALLDSVRAAAESSHLGANGATHYYNPQIVVPGWGSACQRAPLYREFSQEQIGHHIFLSCGPRLLQEAADIPYADPLRETLENAMTSGSFLLFDEDGNVVGKALSE